MQRNVYIQEGCYQTHLIQACFSWAYGVQNPSPVKRHAYAQPLSPHATVSRTPTGKQVPPPHPPRGAGLCLEGPSHVLEACYCVSCKPRWLPEGAPLAFPVRVHTAVPVTAFPAVLTAAKSTLSNHLFPVTFPSAMEEQRLSLSWSTDSIYLISSIQQNTWHTTGAWCLGGERGGEGIWIEG